MIVLQQLAQWTGLLLPVAIVTVAPSGLNSPPPFMPQTPAEMTGAPSLVAPPPLGLASNDIMVSGENGDYMGKVLVNGTVDGAWKVLTDYNNFASIFPNVEASQVLSSNGNQVTFEQVNVFQIAAFAHRERVVVNAVQQYPEQISFAVTEGNVKSLQGVWRLESVSRSQVLITHQVSIDPGSSIFRDVYLSIYQSELRKTLTALKQEIERRGN